MLYPGWRRGPAQLCSTDVASLHYLNSYWDNGPLPCSICLCVYIIFLLLAFMVSVACVLCFWKVWQSSIKIQLGAYLKSTGRLYSRGKTLFLIKVRKTPNIFNYFYLSVRQIFLGFCFTWQIKLAWFCGLINKQYHIYYMYWIWNLTEGRWRKIPF